MEFQRKPFIEVEDVFNPISGIYDDDNTLNGGSRRRRKTRQTRKSSRRRTKSRSGTFRKLRRLFRRRRRRPGRIRRMKSKGGVKYTKNGQPYIILKSGKARFIKGKRHK